MSIDAYNWAWRQQGLNTGQKLVLLSLADRADEKGYAWPSVTRMAKDTCLDARTIYRHIKSLSLSGLIVITSEPGRGNLYQLVGINQREDTPDKLSPPPLTKSHPCQKVTPDILASTPDKLSPPPLTKTTNASDREPKEEPKENHHHARARESIPSGFSEFWEKYPKKVGKKAALKAWKNAKDKPPLDAIIAALERQRASPQWQEQGGRFIPNPATWLNQGRWEDESDNGQAAVKNLDDLLREKGFQT